VAAEEFFYFSDDGVFMALRYDRWKFVFAEQRAVSLDVWASFCNAKSTKMFDLRADPFERADRDSIYYKDWGIRRMFLGSLSRWRGEVSGELQRVPPRQKPPASPLTR